MKDLSSAKVVAYVRASKDEQVLTIDRQQYEITQWATLQRLTVQRFYIDAGVSGTIPLHKREALSQLLLALENNPPDFVVIQRRDRLGRDLYESTFFEKLAAKKHVKVLTLNESPADVESPERRLMTHLLDAYAEFESKLISARTKAGLAQASLKKGYSVNSRAYEFTHSGRAILAAVASVAEWYGYSDRLIADDLITKGVTHYKKNAKGVFTYLTPREIRVILKRFEHEPDLYRQAVSNIWDERSGI